MTKKASLFNFYGEIYNYLDLREQLIKLGHKFRTNGDTEVLLKSYIQWKADCFYKMRHVYFAFVMKNRKRFF